MYVLLINLFCPSYTCIYLISPFSCGWASGSQFVFFWDNVNSQKCVWIILLKMTFWISQGKVATSVRRCEETCNIYVKFSEDLTCQQLLTLVNFRNAVYMANRELSCDLLNGDIDLLVTLALSLHSSDEPGELSQWLWSWWQHHKHCHGYYYYYYDYYWVTPNLTSR